MGSTVCVVHIIKYNVVATGVKASYCSCVPAQIALTGDAESTVVGNPSETDFAVGNSECVEPVVIDVIISLTVVEESVKFLPMSKSPVVSRSPFMVTSFIEKSPPIKGVSVLELAM